MRMFVQEGELQQTKPGKTVTPHVTRAVARSDLHLLRQLQRSIGNRAMGQFLRETTSNATGESDSAYSLTRRWIQRLRTSEQDGAARTAPPFRVNRVRDEQQDQETTGQSHTAAGEGGARQAEIAAASTQPVAASAPQVGGTAAVAEGAGGAQTGKAAENAGATEAAGSSSGAANEQSGTVRNAPSASSIIPFDRSPLAAPGERIIFNAMFTDPSPGTYKLEYSTTGGHFTSDSGPTTRTIDGLNSGNVDFFVPSPWNGRTAVQVVLKVKKKSDDSVVQTETWNFGLKTRYPTTITQVESAAETNLPGVYTYDIGPALATGSKPFYEHQTILERFGAQTLGNIGPADIAPAYRTSHSLDSAAKVSQHFVDSGSGGNGTFTVDHGDQIADLHGGHPDLSNLVANLAAPKDIEVVLPQTYESKPGTALGNFKITRILRRDGTTWKVKKAKT